MTSIGEAQDQNHRGQPIQIALDAASKQIDAGCYMRQLHSDLDSNVHV